MKKIVSIILLFIMYNYCTAQPTINVVGQYGSLKNVYLKTAVDSLLKAKIIQPNSSANFANFTSAQLSASGTMCNILDQYTDEIFSATPATTLPNGTEITNSNVNSVTVFKNGNTFFIRTGSVNVLNFGADKTGLTNSSAAFQAAVDALPIGAHIMAPVGSAGDYFIGDSASGGVVIVPAGNYRLNDQVQVSNQVTIKGAGISATYIVSHYNNGPVFRNKSVPGIFANLYVNYSDFTIDGRLTTGDATGIQYNICNYSTLTNVQFLGFANRGLDTRDMQYLNIYNCVFRYNKKYGVYLGVDSFGLPSNNCHLYGCFIESNKTGMFMSGGNNGIYGGTIQMNTDTGLVIGDRPIAGYAVAATLTPALNTVVEGVHFEGHLNGYDIYIVNNALNTTIDKCFFVAPTATKARTYIFNAGYLTKVVNSGSQAANIPFGNGKFNIANQSVIGGDLTIEGGNWGAFLTASQLVDMVDSLDIVVNNPSSYSYHVKVKLASSNGMQYDETAFRSVHSKRADIGDDTYYFDEPNPRLHITGWDGSHVWMSQFFSNNGASQATTGIQLKDISRMGTIGSGSWSIDSAESTTTAPPKATLQLGSKSIWTYNNQLWISSHFPTTSTDGQIVNANPSGTATLLSGSVTIAAPQITANSKIFITINTPSGTLGYLAAPVANITAGTGFIIKSYTSAGLFNEADNSTVNWFFIN